MKHKKQIEKVALLKSIDCNILKYGNKKANIEFYYCSCDPEEKDTICSECAKTCHKGHKLSVIQYGMETCKCGLRCHKIENISVIDDYIYSPKCFFHKWSEYSNKCIFYIYKNIKICMFCRNFCKESFIEDEIIRVKSDEIPECMCVHSNHDDIISILKKMNYIFFLDEYDFLDIMQVQLFNLIFKSKESFDNLYSNFVINLNHLKVKLKEKSFSLDLHFQFIGISFAIKNFCNLINNVKYFYYFDPKLIDFFDTEFIMDLLKKKFDYTMQNIWQLKANVITIFRKAVFLPEFENCPSLKVRDIVNMNPLMRLLFTSNIKNNKKINENYVIKRYSTKSINSENKISFIESLFNILNTLIPLKVNFNEQYIIIHKLYGIIKVCAKYNLLESGQVIKICLINDEILNRFNEYREDLSRCNPYFKNINKLNEITNYENLILISMIKILMFIVFYTNDNQIERCLKGNIDINNVNYFHLKNPLSKVINRSLINIMNFSKRYYEKMEDNEFSLSILAHKNLKKMKKILEYALDMISFSLNYSDLYLIPLRNLLGSQTNTLMKFLTNDLNVNENDFVEFLNKETLEVEKKYNDFFQLNIEINALMEFVKISLERFFTFTGTNEFKPIHLKLSGSSSDEEDSQNSFKNLSNIIFVNKEKSKKIKIYPSGNKVFHMDNHDNDQMLKNILHSNYRILINKSFYLFTILKFLKILFDYNKKKLIKVKLELNDDIFDLIIKLIYFYTENNPENCIVILSSDFSFTFNTVDKRKFDKLIDLFINCFKTLRIKNHKFSKNLMIFTYIKDLIIKILNNSENINRYISKILKLMKCFIEIPSLDHEKTIKKMKKLLILIHTKYDILRECKSFLIKREEHRKKSLQRIVESRVELEESTYSKFKQVHYTSEEEKKDLSIISNMEDENRNLLSSISNKINESIQIMKFKTKNDSNKNDIEIEREEIEKMMTSKQKTVIITDIINVINKRMRTLNVGNKEIISTENRECTELTADIEEKNKLSPKLLRLFYLYLNLINNSFEMICTEEEKEFLKSVMSLEEISEILRNYDLDIAFRTEILKFFKLAYFSKSIDETKIGNYVSLFIDSDGDKHHEVFDDYENLKFNENFTKIHSFQYNLAKIFSIIRLELKYYALVLTNPNNQINTESILFYLEEGIIIPLFHFMNLFLPNMFLHTGYQYLQLYEIIYYYLNLKFFIFENKHIFDKYILMEQKEYFKDPDLINKHKKILLIYSNLNVSDLSELEEDFREISSRKFEIFNFKLLLTKINRHLFEFIRKPKCKSILFQFTNSNELYSKAKIEKLEKKLKEGNFLMNDLDHKVFKLIIKYENDKRLLKESKFLKVLSERNSTKNNRFLLFRIFFYLINLEKQGGKYIQQCLFNILRLMQFDTKGSQDDIKIIFSNSNYSTKNLIEKLIEYLLIVIFQNSDPSFYKKNKNYMLAVNILKILKFMCEEHNNYFQRIMFNKVKLEYISQDVKTPRVCSLVDFLLCVLMKIIMLAKWENVIIGDDENRISYFYDIFFVIVEFLVEMVQGTKLENLENLIVKLPDMEKPVFSIFLSKIRKILLSNKNDSECLYKVRKDLIDFIMSFLEEKNTPEKLVRTISSLFVPFALLGTIIKTMKKLFLKYKRLENNLNVDVINYKKIFFDQKMYIFFKKKFYYDSDFITISEFTLCNRMYQYIKLLALEYHNDDSILITETIYNLDEKIVKEDMREDINTHSSHNLRLHKKFHFLYYCIKFFEDITRSVYVYKEEEKLTVRVLFTINPLTIYLTDSTKKSFLQNVNRQNRFSKISFLLESCHFFFEEIIYNYENYKRGYLLRFLTEIDYKILEKVMFVFTLIINILMICFLHLEEGSSEENVHRILSSSSGSTILPSTPKIITFGNTNIKDTVYSITILQILLNLAITICWFINKYPLSFILEKKNFSLKNINYKNLSLIQKINLRIINPIIRRNEISFFIWNIFFSFLIVYLPDHIYIYSLQILCIIKLSNNLQNVVKAVTFRYKQLFLAWVFIIITTFIFACFGYFLFYDYWDNHGDSDFCRSLIGCFLLNLNLGMREHGGAGDLLKRYSYVDYEKYMANFFFCLLYRIICMYILEEIVVGITIDTFAEIREQSNIRENDIASICFICGGNRDELEKKGMNFENHTIKEHNLWNYVDYVIGLKFVDKQETNAINSYVINLIENNNITWIPAFKKLSEEV